MFDVLSLSIFIAGTTIVGLSIWVIIALLPSNGFFSGSLSLFSSCAINSSSLVTFTFNSYGSTLSEVVVIDKT